MARLALRLRIFAFFAAFALGAVTATVAGLWLGFRQAETGDTVSAFISAGAVAGFGILALAAGIWLLFDENVAKPVERLAAELRARAHGGVSGALDPSVARYLGDLAPAAAAISGRLSEATASADDAISARTAHLAAEKAQLTAILTDIPLAIMLMNPRHQIVLYDGQSADLLAVEGHCRLNAPLFDYFKEGPILAALETLKSGPEERCPIVVETHSGAVYSGHMRQLRADAGYMLMLEPLSPDAERPLTFDFDLLHGAAEPGHANEPLKQQVFVIFDSETTGLDPTQDDVVQIGAVRVVNGRIVAGERFDMLVNPGRPIPSASTRVHGIDDAMVAEAAPIDAAVRAFHGFARDAVLVAHNAPFDLAFLRRYGPAAGLEFDHPVLDTVLLSAVLFGGSATHTLDALADRLGVEIAEDDRHTALGDAIATADVFVACLGMLEARGFTTFGEVLKACRKHERIVKDVNRS